MGEIRVAIAGIGNCAASLIQGIHYYGDNFKVGDEMIGLAHPILGGYAPGDVKIVAAIETHQVPLSALWVFDYSPQDKDWNVTFDNDRSYMLRLIAEANRRMQKRLKRNQSTQPGDAKAANRPHR